MSVKRFFSFSAKNLLIVIFMSIICLTSLHKANSTLPIVINTWPFTNANLIAWKKLTQGGSALDAVEIGCSTCEREQCDGTVGYGGSPDEAGETTLDAMIMDGKTMNVGAVGALRFVKSAISVARSVLEHTQHSFLVGSQATKFALEMGFIKESLSTDTSTNIWKQWQTNNCQPNYRLNVLPNPKNSCGPYKPISFNATHVNDNFNEHNELNHDTIGIVAIDKHGNIAVATSTNGCRHKIPGRVGDSPIIGAGGYVENGVGGAAATGDGDILMRFLPSFKAVENLKSGLSPQESAEKSLSNIMKYYATFVGGIIVVSADGSFSAACHGINEFPFSVTYGTQTAPIVLKVGCLQQEKNLLPEL